ncbi:MAG: signal peptide peptidase SppA [Nitrospirota bacterium]
MSVNLIAPVEPLKEKRISGKGKDKILLVDVSGVISGEEEGLGGEPGLVERIKEELTKASKDNRIKAIILRINSPGGTVTASDIIYNEIMRYKEKNGVKVIASIMDLGASGAYYIAQSADRITALPTSVVGSIGVIMIRVDIGGLLEKIGVEANPIKSGEKKDMGSPFRPLTPEEQEIFQSVIDSMHERFLGVIVKGRGIELERLKKIADGRIYTAGQAKAIGLIDGIDYLDDTIESTKREAGLDDASVVVYYRPSSYKNNIYSKISGERADLVGIGSREIRDMIRPRFMYLWLP